MNATQKKTVLDILTGFRDNDIESSGTKRSLTATIKKVQAGSIVAVDGVTAALNATADKATIDTDAKTLRDVVKRIAKLTAPARQTAVKAVKATGAQSGKGTAKKAAVKAVQTGDAGTVTVRTNGRKPSPTKVRKLVSDADEYQTVIDDLAQLGIKAALNDGPDGLSANFDRAGYHYRIWSPTFNSSGEDEGWVITYNDDPSSNDDTYVDQPLKSNVDVVVWIAEDLGIELPKPTAKRQAPRPAERKTAIVNSTAIGTYVNAARVALETGRNIAEQVGGQDRDTMQLFQQLIETTASLRQLVDGE